MLDNIFKIGFISIVLLVGCGPKKDVDPSQVESPTIRPQIGGPTKSVPENVEIKEGVEKVFCGKQSAEITWQVRHNKDKHTNLFAILLNGSPVTQYFSDQGYQSGQLTDKLIERGYKIFEIKYPSSGGFYTLCAHQGIEKIAQHCADVYEVAVKHLGFNRNDQNHILASVGWSIGAIQLQAMSFMMGKRIDKIALMGVLMGDVEQGCKSALARKEDGYSWAIFHPLARIVTINGKGCSSPSEFTSSLSFENQRYFDQWSLGLFEGESKKTTRRQIAGNIAQVKYIQQKRQEAGAPVELYSYPGCGHEIMECTKGKVVDDILTFFENK